jgi:hypothetical protein
MLFPLQIAAREQETQYGEKYQELVLFHAIED